MHWLKSTMVLAAFALAGAAATAASACEARTPCETAHGRYFLRTPAQWDGRTPLPVAVFFHGYRSSAADVMGDDDLGQALSQAGVALVAPDGLNGSWTIQGKLQGERDDIGFTREILADLKKRLPVDDRLTLAAGFSAGGFMVWQLACRAGGLFAAYASIAGVFLDPIPDSCPTGPVSLRHVHGKSDVTVPMAGRWIAGGRIRQSDVRDSLARLRAVDGCPVAPARVSSEDGLECETWPAADCASGRELVLCLHADAHMMKGRWVVDAFDWARKLPRQAGH